MTVPMPDRVRVSGPLALFADGFRGQLGERGYTACAMQFSAAVAGASEPLDAGPGR